ncbi:MAG: AraC family transcriptional regulator ligand-binding domain-containing protein [Aquabacterium sp.]|nr:AraC family transcriptional regulator ligand-binding domain-containing protein [Aquabacterium sp.]
MREITCVNGAWIRLLLDWLDREGLHAASLRACISTYEPDGEVPLCAWGSMLERAAALRPMQTGLGLDIGSGVTQAHVGLLGYLIATTDSLAQALTTYQRYERLFYRNDLAKVSSHREGLTISWAQGQGGPLVEEVSIAALVTFMRHQALDPPPPSSIEFTFPASQAHLQACETFFGCPVRFNRPYTAICIPQSLLAWPLIRREPGLRQLLAHQAQAMLQALPTPGDFEQSVQRVLVRLLPEGRADIDSVAETLNVSRRTLQRRLGDKGITWQQMLEGTRDQLARRYLDDLGLSLAEIAMLLGYSEQSAFSRSFRRWTGYKPLAWRRRERTT